jgi:hypothetical protein
MRVNNAFNGIARVANLRLSLAGRVPIDAYVRLIFGSDRASTPSQRTIQARPSRARRPVIDNELSDNALTLGFGSSRERRDPPQGTGKHGAAVRQYRA